MSKPNNPNYDVTKLEREVIEWKHKRRLELRDMLLREAYHPVKSHIPVDDGLYRAAAARAEMGRFFTPNVHTTGCLIAIVCGISFVGYLLCQDKHKERDDRSKGKVDYDRMFKFQ